MLQPWVGADALTAQEDTPFGVVSDGVNVLFTTGRNQVGERSVRIVPAQPGGSSRILVTEPGGLIPNGPLALDGGDLYVAAGSSVVKVSVSTGEAVPVVTGRPTDVSSVAVDSRYVWWTASMYGLPAAAEVARMPKRGGPVEILAAGEDGKGGVWRDEPARKAVMIPRGSSFDAIRPDGESGVAYVASPQGVLRVGDRPAPEFVVGEKALGGPPTRIAIDADHVYAEVAGGKDELIAVAKSGGAPLALAKRADDTSEIAVADGEVYYFENDRLYALPVTGGESRVIASGKYNAGDLAVVGDRLVFSAADRVWSAYRRRP